MNRIILIISLLFFSVLFSPSCKVEQGNGILGIEVPIGDGRVSDDTPYLVSGVYEDTPAYKAGIRPGDIIIQINDMPVTKGMKFNEIYSTQLTGKPGTKVIIHVKRGAENIIFDLVRAERGN